MNSKAFKPCLSIKSIPCYKLLTNDEQRMVNLLKRVANKKSKKSEDLALSYYRLVLDRYGNLAATRFFKSYVYRINDKYKLNLKLPQ